MKLEQQLLATVQNAIKACYDAQVDAEQLQLQKTRQF